MSLTSVDLPDPLTPVTAVSTPSGILTSMFLRLFARAPDDQIALHRRPAPLRRRNRLRARERRGGQRGAFSAVRRVARRARTAAAQQLLRRALEDHAPAEIAGTRTEIDHVVRDANRLLVVLDDDYGVPEVAKARERRQQLAVVALMETDRRLVEHVQHAGEVRADLRREADALSFAARQRRGAAAERQVADADVVEKTKALLDLLQNPLGD